PTVSRHMTGEERRAETERAEQFHERPDYTVKEPDWAEFERMNAAALMRRETEARLGLDKAAPKTIFRPMNDSEVQLERDQAKYHHEEPNFRRVMDHEAMAAHAALRSRTKQLSMPVDANA